MSAEPTPTLRSYVAEEVRVWLTRRRLSGVKLAAAIGRSQPYVSRRLNGETAFDVDDLERIAAVLGVSPETLVRRHGGTTQVPTAGLAGDLDQVKVTRRAPLTPRVVAVAGDPVAPKTPTARRAVRLHPHSSHDQRHRRVAQVAQ
jgi:transcriptional regulator with XRE-family HTH domain